MYIIVFSSIMSVLFDDKSKKVLTTVDLNCIINKNIRRTIKWQDLRRQLQKRKKR